MNGLEFAIAVVHVLNHRLGPIFGDMPDESLQKRLREQEVTPVEMRSAVRAMLCSVLPKDSVHALSDPYEAIFHDRAGPDEAYRALTALTQLMYLQEERVPARDLHALLDDPEWRVFAVDTVKQFFACLAGDTLSTYEERRAVETVRAKAIAADLHAQLNWGSIMNNAANLLVVADYLRTFPQEEQEEALIRAVRHLHVVLHEEEQRFQEGVAEGAQNDDETRAANVILDAMKSALKVFCTEHAYRPSDGEGA